MRMHKQIYYVTNGDKSYRKKKNNDGGHTVEGVGYRYQLTTSVSKEPWRNQGVLGFLWHKQAKKDIMNKIITDGFKRDRGEWSETGKGKGLARNTQDHISTPNTDDVISVKGAALPKACGNPGLLVQTSTISHLDYFNCLLPGFPAFTPVQSEIYSPPSSQNDGFKTYPSIFS